MVNKKSDYGALNTPADDSIILAVRLPDDFPLTAVELKQVISEMDIIVDSSQGMSVAKSKNALIRLTRYLKGKRNGVKSIEANNTVQ